jgi:hypothetical protein
LVFAGCMQWLQRQQQMPGQQMQQAVMQEMHALHMQQAAAAAAAAAAVASSQQIHQQQGAQQMQMQQPQQQMQQVLSQQSDSSQQSQLPQQQQQMQIQHGQQQASGAAVVPQILLSSHSMVSQAPCVLPTPAPASMSAPMDCSMQLDAAVAAAAAAATAAGRHSPQAVGMQQQLGMHQQLTLQQPQQQQLGQQQPPAIRWSNHNCIPGMAHTQGSTMRLGSDEALNQVGVLQRCVLQAALLAALRKFCGVLHLYVHCGCSMCSNGHRRAPNKPSLQSLTGYSKHTFDPFHFMNTNSTCCIVIITRAALLVCFLQAGFVAVMRGVPACDQPSKYLSFRYPARGKAPVKKSGRLNANDLQVGMQAALLRGHACGVGVCVLQHFDAVAFCM